MSKKLKKVKEPLVYPVNKNIESNKGLIEVAKKLVDK